jgi:ATP-binding cassette subfamily G (WHITE) protein 2 (SNQ2)
MALVHAILPRIRKLTLTPGNDGDSFLLRAEFILDVIGAGATASSTLDWEAIWRNSSESAKAREELDRIHAEGRSRGAVKATFTAKYASTWIMQATSLLRRDFRFRWRDVCFPPFFGLRFLLILELQPTYLLAKLVLNIVAGLFIGVKSIIVLDSIFLTSFQFTFFQAKTTQQGTQNQLFVPSFPSPSCV